MCLAADLSHRLGWLSAGDLARARALIAAAGLPVVPPPELTPQAFRDLMAVDKKVQDGRLRLVLLQGIGTSLVTGNFDLAKLDETLSQA